MSYCLYIQDGHEKEAPSKDLIFNLVDEFLRNLSKDKSLIACNGSTNSISGKMRTLPDNNLEK